MLYLIKKKKDGHIMKDYMKPLMVLLLIVFVCSSLVRIFSHSESLSDYVAKNQQTQEGETKQAENLPDSIDEFSTQPDTGDVNSSETNADRNTNGNVVAETSSETETSLESETEEAAGDEGNSSGGSLKENANLYFYYEPLSDEIVNRISGISYVENENISLDELRYVHILHYDFDGEVTEGELICNKAIAQDLLEIFYELYLSEYKIEKVRLIDEYDGDDTASMEDNNTSCFNYRVVDGTTSLSKHAYGLAIDINPFYNPYVVFKSEGSTYISPKGSEGYADRSLDFPYKIDDEDLCYKLFQEHGFIWGGNWNSCKDYQHFQKVTD